MQGSCIVAHVEPFGSCYFLHPGAQVPLDPEFHSCGFAAVSSKSKGQTDDDTAKYQHSIDVHTSGITRRTFLLIIFLLKEANFVRHDHICAHKYTPQSLLLPLFPSPPPLSLPSIFLSHAHSRVRSTRWSIQSKHTDPIFDFSAIHTAGSCRYST